MGEVMLEKRIETRMRIADSRVLKKSERRTGIMYSVSPCMRSMAKSAIVERRVTAITVVVSPKHLPMTTSVRVTGFG